MICEDIFGHGDVRCVVMLDVSSVRMRRMMWNTFKFRESFKNFMLQS